MSARPAGGRLICVSNRVGTVRGAPLAGGLAVALSNALRANQGLWFGWSGKTAAEAGPVAMDEAHGIRVATLDLPKSDFDAYYAGYSNNVLWPLFHFRLDLVRYERAQYEAYRRINALIARRVAELARPEDRIWVHDYHLIPLAEELRALGLKNRIGFFLHIPMPPRELLVAMPGNRELMGSLMYYDLVGLQTHADRYRLHHYAKRELECAVNEEGLSAFGRRVRTGAFPVGIDVEEFESFANSPKACQETRRMRLLLDGRTQIIGVDRLDYSKGLLRRAAGYERLLEKYPRVQRNVDFLQVTPISRGEVQAALSEQAAAAAHAGGDVSRQPHRAGHADPRRHEPRGQGVRRCTGSGGSGRADPVVVRRSRGTATRCAAGQSIRRRRGGRCDGARANDGTRRTDRTPSRADRGSATRQLGPLAGVLSAPARRRIDHACGQERWRSIAIQTTGRSAREVANGA
ncbi:MAG: alpha,alpha-trehalose-phosphate synthase [Panacagrimonas sp.]|nr:trehalose-6-phosphate synthase [Panacagrimonas sp.]MCC2658086.1 alpha,alpha-trehalose-phosphate synthase [Panacagrimonas sp.]